MTYRYLWILAAGFSVAGLPRGAKAAEASALSESLPAEQQALALRQEAVSSTDALRTMLVEARDHALQASCGFEETTSLDPSASIAYATTTDEVRALAASSRAMPVEEPPPPAGAVVANLSSTDEVRAMLVEARSSAEGSSPCVSETGLVRPDAG